MSTLYVITAFSFVAASSKPDGLFHFNFDSTISPDQVKALPMFFTPDSTMELLNMDHIIASTYHDDPKSQTRRDKKNKMSDSYTAAIELNLEWKHALYADPSGDAYQCIRQMFHVRNALPITPDRLVNRLDQVPATDYIWLFVVYDSSRPRDECKLAKALADIAAEYFYEYVMIGTIDMAYPSNRASFGPIVTEMPSLIVKFPHTDLKSLAATQIDWKPNIQLAPLKQWGTYIPRQDLEDDARRTFERIIEKYWNELQSWHQIASIYSVFYHHPRKALFQKAIESMENDIHQQLHRRAYVTFKLEPGSDEFNEFMVKFTYHEKVDAMLRQYLERIKRENRGAVMNNKLQTELEPRNIPDLGESFKHWQYAARNQVDGRQWHAEL